MLINSASRQLQSHVRNGATYCTLYLISTCISLMHLAPKVSYVSAMYMYYYRYVMKRDVLK